MKVRAALMNPADINRALKRIAHQILERNQGAENIVLLGIKRGGVPLARILSENILAIEGIPVAVGELDITSFRDDLTGTADNTSVIPFDIKDVMSFL